MVAFTIFSLESAIAQRRLGASISCAVARAVSRSALRADTRRIAKSALQLLLQRQRPGVTWELRSDSRGKPYAVTSSGDPGPAVSVSHARGWIACAVADRPVGIDVEHARARDYTAIAEYAFGARENARVRDSGLDGFYRIWTVREAIAKTTGEGLALVTDRHDRAHGGPDEGRWMEQGDGGTWLLAHLRPAPGLSAAVAVFARGGATWANEPFDEVQANTLFCE